MASGIGPKLPLLPDDVDGAYALTKDLKDTIKQNFRNLMLTIPGERIMLPDFGVGIARYLFENQTNSRMLLSSITSRVQDQTKRHMPFITINSVNMNTAENDPTMSPHTMILYVEYFITPLNQGDSLEIGVDLTGEVIL